VATTASWRSTSTGPQPLRNCIPTTSHTSFAQDDDNCRFLSPFQGQQYVQAAAEVQKDAKSSTVHVLTESMRWRRQRCLKIAQIENRLKEEQQAYDEAAEGIEKLRVRVALLLRTRVKLVRSTFKIVSLAVAISLAKVTCGHASHALHEGWELGHGSIQPARTGVDKIIRASETQAGTPKGLCLFPWLRPQRESIPLAGGVAAASATLHRAHQRDLQQELRHHRLRRRSDPARGRRLRSLRHPHQVRLATRLQTLKPKVNCIFTCST